MELTELDRREWFREHWAHGIPFNEHCGIQVRRWDDEAVEWSCPMRRCQRARGYLHGGVVAALLDTTGSGAVMAGQTSPRAAA